MRRYERSANARRQTGNGSSRWRRCRQGRQPSHAGFTLIEMVLVIGILAVIMAFAIPITINAVHSTRLAAAVSSATGAIQSTRYQAIWHGYPYQITFTPSTLSYQVLNEVPPATTFSDVGTAIPISTPDAATLSRTITIQFAANGTVTEITTPPNGVSPLTFQITNSYGGSNTISVSGVGYVSVSSP